MPTDKGNTMFDPTKPVQTRNGNKKARIVCSDMKGEQPIIALIETGDGGEFGVFLRANGQICEHETNEWDVVNIPDEVTLERWAVVHTDRGVVTICNSEAFAIKFIAGFEQNYVIVKLTGKYTR